MNLILRPLHDVNDITWSIVISLIILLIGVSYYIYTIMSMAFKELKDAEPDRTQRRRAGSGDSTSETPSSTT